MSFDPKPNRFPYTEITDQHYLKLKKNRGIVFDENYPYVDYSKGFIFKQWWTRVFMYLVVFPVDAIRIGIKVLNKKNLKIYKNVINQGVISVSNHIHMWDYITLNMVIKPIKPYVLVWPNNINGENGPLIKLTGGIPIPEKNVRGIVAYFKAIEKLLKEDHGWLHIYPEGSMWEYYAPIRPFKRGPAFFAVKFDKPIIPIGYSYRKPSWFRKKVMKQYAKITMNIGKPIYPNKEIKDLTEREYDLTRRIHEAVCELSFIDPKENLYPALFDNNKRVDYYTSKYGVGYKGSW